MKNRSFSIKKRGVICVVVIFTTLILIAAAFFATSGTYYILNLTEYDEAGSYYLPLTFKGNQKIFVHVDMGSSALNIVGCKEDCKKCTLRDERIIPVNFPELKKEKTRISVVYGNSSGYFAPLETSVSLSPELSIDNQMIGVFQEGKNLNNILGLGYYENQGFDEDNSHHKYFQVMSVNCCKF